ncbi:unnamed protein product [Caretta caretta]
MRPGVLCKTPHIYSSFPLMQIYPRCKICVCAHWSPVALPSGCGLNAATFIFKEEGVFKRRCQYVCSPVVSPLDKHFSSTLTILSGYNIIPRLNTKFLYKDLIQSSYIKYKVI